jgi:hypothetical protein
LEIHVHHLPSRTSYCIVRWRHANRDGLDQVSTDPVRPNPSGFAAPA